MFQFEKNFYGSLSYAIHFIIRGNDNFTDIKYITDAKYTHDRF